MRTPSPTLAPLLAFLLAVTTATSSVADGSADFFRVEVGSSNLNLRAAPTTSATVLVQFTSGTVVRNLGCREAEGRTWCAVEQQIRYGVRGWAASEFLRATESAESRRWVGEAVVAATAPGAVRQVACAITPDAPLIACEFGVVRGASGNAVLVIQLPDGGQRTIEFEAGSPISSDAGLIASRKSGGVTRVAVGATERYAIPDSVVDDRAPVGNRPGP